MIYMKNQKMLFQLYDFRQLIVHRDNDTYHGAV